jgi:predicted MPP superfamily phosphohydrolase
MKLTRRKFIVTALLATPLVVGADDLGLFHTKSGPLYVTSGIGWFPIPVRFNCRPEIVLVEV